MKSRVVISSARTVLALCLMGIVAQSHAAPVLTDMQLSTSQPIVFNNCCEITHPQTVSPNASYLQAAHIENIGAILSDKVVLNTIL